MRVYLYVVGVAVCILVVGLAGCGSPDGAVSTTAVVSTVDSGAATTTLGWLHDRRCADGIRGDAGG